MLYEFKTDIAIYLAGRAIDKRHADVPPMLTLADLIAFNETHAAEEMLLFTQDIFEMSQKKGPLTDTAYERALETSRRIATTRGIDAVMQEHRLDALIAPTGSPAWKIDVVHGDMVEGGSSSAAARAGYPLITVPAGFVDDLPVGISFMAGAYAEPQLLTFAYAFEQATKARRPPNLPRVGAAR